MAEIAQLCTVQLGCTARGRLELAEDGIPAVQLRDTRTEGGMAQVTRTGAEAEQH